MPDSGLPQTDRPRMAELLDIAARLFNEKGYKATSLAEIGDALGMNKASLYYYVKSKDDLLAHVIYRASQRLRVLAEGIAENRDDPGSALSRLVRTHCNTILDHPDEFGTVIFQRRHIASTVLPEIAERERVYFDAVKDLVARGAEDGVFRRCDTGIAAQMLLDTMNGILRWYRPDGRLSRDTAIDEIVAFATHALAGATT
jgi:TetR/AcrR family transcriptional regulator, cholesterol catabolism regulator